MTSKEGKQEELKGRTKKAAGELTGDKQLKREGSIDKAKGKAKQTIDKAGDKIKGRDRK